MKLISKNEVSPTQVAMYFGAVVKNGKTDRRQERTLYEGEMRIGSTKFKFTGVPWEDGYYTILEHEGVLDDWVAADLDFLSFIPDTDSEFDELPWAPINWGDK